MPIIPGADLTSVSTDFELYPDGEYTVTILGSELTEGNKQLRIKTRIEQPVEFQGKPFTDFINLIQNDGKQNQMGLTNIKRYLEAVYGKGSAEAEASPPDSDLLDNKQVKLQLAKNSYVPKNPTEFNPDGSPKKKENNQVKRVFPA